MSNGELFVVQLMLAILVGGGIFIYLLVKYADKKEAESEEIRAHHIKQKPRVAKLLLSEKFYYGAWLNAENWVSDWTMSMKVLDQSDNHVGTITWDKKPDCYATVMLSSGETYVVKHIESNSFWRASMGLFDGQGMMLAYYKKRMKGIAYHRKDAPYCIVRHVPSILRSYSRVTNNNQLLAHLIFADGLLPGQMRLQSFHRDNDLSVIERLFLMAPRP